MAEELPDRNAAFSYYEDLIRGIADKDPSQTARLVGQLDVDETQLNIVHREWMEARPDSAKKWVESLPESDRALLVK
jgi:hypothetical protein